MKLFDNISSPNKIKRSIDQPLRQIDSYEEKWNGFDKGLIFCWEKGREMREKDPSLSMKAINNELPVLVWKGGIPKELKMKMKYGTMQYLAMWYGLRNEDLEIDINKEYELVCSKNNVKVIFTNDSSKYLI